jgi:hypothetical protein
MIGYEAKLERVLDRMGGIYHWRDIKERLDDGRMQSFAHNNSMLITQINVYPRGRVFDWLAAVGDMQDWEPIHEAAVRFAERCDISLIRAYGRRGWAPFIGDHGWKTLTVNQLYQKEL